MSFVGFGRKVFGRKGTGSSQPAGQPGSRLFGSRGQTSGNAPFDRHFEQVMHLTKGSQYPVSGCRPALDFLSPEERGELLVDLASRPGIYDGYMRDKPTQEMIAYNTLSVIWQSDIEVRPEHLGAILTLLTGNKNFRERSYYDTPFKTLLRLIDSAIRQGAYLSSKDCEALAQMASDIRNARKSYSKADTKKMIARAEKLEKLAGAEVSVTEFLMQRCEGAENPFAIADKPRPHADFWAELLAEVTAALDEIRLATKGSAKPGWSRDAAIFVSTWPGCGEVQPSFEAWKSSNQPVQTLVQHNGKRYGWASPDEYRRLPDMLAGAQAHSRYNWNSDQIPGLDVLADLENPAWTALVEHLITQRRATKATKVWQKEALALCAALGIEDVEARLHDWLALFHTPALGRVGYTNVCNGERFAAAIERLEEAHPEWPVRHAHEIIALGRAIAIMVASGASKDIASDFHPQLVRLDDQSYKNKSATTGVLHMLKPGYKHGDGRGTYDSMASWMRLSVENEEFLRGALWLVALMPDRSRAIQALELTAQSAATYTRTGDEGMRSKIIANAAIATLIDMGGSDIDPAALRLSKVVEHQSVRAPLLTHLNLAE